MITEELALPTIKHVLLENQDHDAALIFNNITFYWTYTRSASFVSFESERFVENVSSPSNGVQNEHT